MKYSSIDGAVLEKMMRNALSNLRLHEEEVNNLNVFPVPDGDTGTNMRRTLEMGVESAPKNRCIGEYLSSLSSGMLLGARGNSGVILSQIFKGVANALTRYETASAGNLVAAFVRGYRAAYAVVVRPVEGTILTVVREGIERAKKQVYRKTTVETMLSIYLTEMQKTLKTTPFLLPVLKEAGVVDSGGYGFVLIVDGMLKALYDENIVAEKSAPSSEEVGAVANAALFGANSKFEFGYCMEFMLQLMNKKAPVKNFNLDYYIEEIKAYGESLVAIKDDTRVRVHVHTFKPEKIIAISRELGEFTFFKLENMQLQNEALAENKEGKKDAKSEEKKQLAIIAVVDGGGFEETFKSIGCDVVIDGGKTMNTSVQEFLQAYEKCNAENIVVLPNNKNVIIPAQQAAQLYGGNVEVIASTSIADGYFAVASDLPDLTVKERVTAIKNGMSGITNLSVFRAIKSRTLGGVECKEGDYIAFINGKLVASDTDMSAVTINAMRLIEGIEDKEQALIFANEAAGALDALMQKIGDEFGGIQTDCIYGGDCSAMLVIGVL